MSSDSTHAAPQNPTPAPAPAADSLAPALRSAMLQALSGVQRLVIVLWYAEHMNPTEIAQAVDLTTDQVHRHHDEALQVLRQSVGLQAA